ncbi:MAG: hypothetical protein IKU37_04760 [Candidatus Gastranaerophilales bacterium]|nr:hypothetical protein [Candidatus Gastranaerophilales bacterium]
MDFVKKILLILFLVLITFSSFEANASCQISTSNFATISAIKPIEKDFINSKENEFSLSAIQNVNTQITTRRNNDSNNNMPDDHIIVFAKKNNNLKIYTCNQSYLDDKNELALLLLLHQIQPNAP